MKVFVYLNRRKKCYSVRAEEGEYRGKVVGYANRLLIENAQFIISSSGQRRLLRTGVRNVHAGVCGDLVAWIGATHNGHGLPVPPGDNRYAEMRAVIDDLISDGSAVVYRPLRGTLQFTVLLSTGGLGEAVSSAPRSFLCVTRGVRIPRAA